MAGDTALVSRSVVCPQCHADAVLTYAAHRDAFAETENPSIVYVCPNLCAPPHHQLTGLLPHDP
jgi:hypothetical protein